MQYTESFNLQKPDYNNIVDISVLNQNFDRIDKGLVLNAGYSTGDNNTYVLTIPDIEKLTSEDIGASFKFFAHKDSTGYVSIKINDDEAKPLYDGKKKQVKKILTGVPYTIVWDGFSNFFLSSGGVDESDETTVGTDGSKVLEGETFIGSDGEIHTGTIPKRGDSTINLGINQTVELPAGYYTKVKATQNVNYHSGGWSPSEYGVYSDYFYEHLDRAYYDGAETRLPISTVARTLGFNENNVVGNVGGISGNAIQITASTKVPDNTIGVDHAGCFYTTLTFPKQPKALLISGSVNIKDGNGDTYYGNGIGNYTNINGENRNTYKESYANKAIFNYPVWSGNTATFYFYRKVSSGSSNPSGNNQSIISNDLYYIALY